MGVVYRATDIRLNRDVALKVLPPELVADADRRERFVREARAASALEHPNIAVIHDIGEVEGVSFIAMELVRGDKLSTAIATGQFASNPGRALEVAAEIAEGLARAHSQGIVHRDLKPANVMLTEDGHAKVIDFGLAKLLSSLSGDGDTVTAGSTDPAVVLGTVSYMAPEQARGGAIDHRTDIFSFGILLYELFSGTLPFKGHGSVETMHAILHGQPPPLRFTADGMPATAAHDVQRIVEKCLAKDPESRYQGMKDLVIDLRSARRRLDTASATETIALPGAAKSRSQRWLIGFASAAVLAAVGLWAWTQSRAPIAQATGTRPSVAVLHFENNTGNTSMDWLRTGLTDMLVTDLSQSTEVEVLSTDRRVQILRDLGKLEDKTIAFETVQELARRAHVKHVLIGSYVKAGETIRINVRLQEAASGKIITTDRVDAANEASLFPTMDTLTSRVKAQFVSSSGGILGGVFTRPGARPAAGIDRDLKDVTTSSMEAYRDYALGIDQHQRSRFLDAIVHFERAVKIDPNFALAYVKMAVASSNMGRSNDRERYAKRALELVDRLTPRERYYIEGFYYSATIEETSRAIAAYEKAIELYPDHSASRNNLATLYIRTDQYDKAIVEYEALREQGFEFPGAAGNLASAYIAAGKPDQGIAVVQDFAGRYPSLESAFMYVGQMLSTVNRFDEADVAFQKGLALRPGFPPINASRSMVRQLRDDFEESQQLGETLVRHPLPQARHLGHVQLAYLHMLRGRTKEALKRLQLGVAEQEPSGTNESASLRTTAAELQLALGRPGEAAAEATRAIADARGRLSSFEAWFFGTIAGVPNARIEYGRVVDKLPVGSDKYLPLLADAVAAVEAGRHAEAIALIARVKPHLPPGPIVAGNILPIRQPNILIAYWSARAQLGTGNHAEAEKLFTEVINAGWSRFFSPIEYVRSFYYLGQLAEKRDDGAKAREHYKRFLFYWKDGDIDRDKVQEALKKTS